MTSMNPQVQRLLDERMSNIAGLRRVVVFSDDGLALYGSGVDQEFADRIAALASSLGSLSDRIADEEQGGGVKRTLIEMEDGYVVVARCGLRSFLMVSVKRNANLGTVGYELSLLTARLAPVLDAQQRQPAWGGNPG
jgi:predicted regulator of Ras-like GTPase activity (Roadblock/LC7/MglB family)